MVDAYNMTEFNNAANPFEMLLWANQQTSYFLGPGILVALFAILFMVLLRVAPPPESFAAASGMTAIMSLAFLAAGLVGVFWTVGFGMLFALSAVGLYLATKA